MAVSTLRPFSKKWGGHDIPLTADHPQDHHGGGELRVLDDRHLVDILADPPIILPIALLVLEKNFLVGEEPEDPSNQKTF